MTGQFPFTVKWGTRKWDHYQRLSGELAETINRVLSIVRTQGVPLRERRAVMDEQVYLMVWQTEADDDVKRFFLEENGLTWQRYTELHGD